MEEEDGGEREGESQVGVLPKGGLLASITMILAYAPPRRSHSYL